MPLPAGVGHVEFIAISPHGSLLATGAGNDLKIIDLTSGTYRWNGKVTGKFPHNHRHAAFSPKNENLLALTTDGGGPFLWDAEKNQPISLRFEGDSPLSKLAGGAVADVGFRPSHDQPGRMAAAMAGGGIVLWDVEVLPPSVACAFTDRTYATALRYAPARDVFALADVIGTVEFLVPDEPLSGPGCLKVETELKGPSGSRVQSLAFSQDGALLALSSDLGSTIVWDVHSRRRGGAAMWGRSAAFGPSFGTDVLATSNDRGTHGLAVLWDFQSASLQADKAGDDFFSMSAAFTPDGARLATVTGHGMVRVWSTNPLVALGEGTRMEGGASAVAFSPNGSRLAVASESGRVSIWEVATWKPVVPEIKLERAVFSLAFAPDGQTLALAHDDGIELVSMESGKPTQVIRHEVDEQHHPVALAFSQDGTLIAEYRRDMPFFTTAFDLSKNGAPLPLTNPLLSWLLRLGYSDGSRAHGADSDLYVDLSDRATIKLSSLKIEPDTSSKELVKLLSESPLGTIHTGQQVRYSLIGPGGKQLLTAGLDGWIKLWNLDFDTLANRACLSMSRNLSPSDFDKYVGKGSGRFQKACPGVPCALQESEWKRFMTEDVYRRICGGPDVKPHHQ